MLHAFRKEKKSLKQLNVVFCSDKFLLDINKKFLKHNFHTDVITFQYNKKRMPAEGEIFISIDSVKSNSKKFETAFRNELHRVIIHGVLHLCGYSDKTPETKTVIKNKEDSYLLKRAF